MAKDKPPSLHKQATLVGPLLETVLDLSRLQAAEPPLQTFLDECVQKIADITGIAHIKVLQYRPYQGDLLVVSGVGWNEGVVGKATLPIDVSSPPGRVIQTGRSTIIEDFARDPEYKLSSLLSNHDIRSLINVPVKADGAVWGVLEADSNQPCHFSDELATFLKTMAFVIGAAIQREQRKTAAEDMRIAVAREVARRDTLLTEMHHRVKNNYQVIISALLIQHRKAKADETKEMLQTMSNRVTAISLAHDQLDPRQASQTVSIPSYLGALCRTIGQAAEDIAIEAELDDGSLPVEKAVAIGLIVNELVTNALKHAFTGTGSVRVKFCVGSGRSDAYLSVTDDGKGMGAGARGRSSGLTLVEALAKQLEGRVERESPKRGTVVRIWFPMK
jgi:two-component sensor histidine kinase/putative methionine-R-sulfoxide reductase with GAF domain